MFKEKTIFAKLTGSELCEKCHVEDYKGNPVAIQIMAPPSAGSGAMLRKQVDTRSCAKSGCHCPSGAGTKLYSKCL